MYLKKKKTVEFESRCVNMKAGFITVLPRDKAVSQWKDHWSFNHIITELENYEEWKRGNFI